MKSSGDEKSREVSDELGFLSCPMKPTVHLSQFLKIEIVILGKTFRKGQTIRKNKLWR